MLFYPVVVEFWDNHNGPFLSVCSIELRIQFKTTAEEDLNKRRTIPNLSKYPKQFYLWKNCKYLTSIDFQTPVYIIIMSTVPNPIQSVSQHHF